MRLSDIIESFLIELIEESGNIVEIKRNELAEHFNCVPSQITYVISTRFNPQQGYYVESRRGGGGSIKIKRIIPKENYLVYIITNMGERLTVREADILINNFLAENIITKKEGRLLSAAINNNVLTVPQNLKDKLRANIFKNMVINLIEE